MFESLKKYIGACFIVCMFLVSSILLPSVSGNIQGTESWPGDLWWDNSNQLTSESELNGDTKFIPNSDSTPRNADARARLIDLNNWTELYGNNLNHGYTTATVPKIAYSVWERRIRDDNENPVPVYSSPVVSGNQVFIGAGNMKLYSLDKYTGAINWEVSTEDMPGTQAGGAIDSSPLVANDRVYVGCDDKYFYCFDATPDDNLDGKIDASDTDEGFDDALVANYDLIWYFRTNGSIKSSPKLSGNTVVIGCYDNHPDPARLFALDATNGDLIWNYTAPLKTKFHSTPAIENDIVYIGLEIEPSSGYPTIYAFDLDGFSDGNDGWTGEVRTGNKDGDIIWNFTTNSGVDSSIVIAGNRLLFGTLASTGLVFALNKNTGAELWNTTTGNPIYAGGAVDLANNAFYIGSDNGKLFAINLSDGNKFWSYSVGAGIKSTPIVANNKVLFGSNDGYFYALKSTTEVLSSEQRFLWSYWTDGSVDATAAAIKGIVYVGSESGYVYGFSNPDLAVEFGSLKLSERDIYEGETIDISAKVFNNGSMRLRAKTNFFLHVQGSGRAVEQILISSHDVDLDINEEVVLHTQTTIPIRDWSLVDLSMILVKIENVSFPEKSDPNPEFNNLDIESITILEPYTGGWMSYQRDNSNKGFGDIGAKTNKTIWKYEPATGAGQFRGSPLFAKGRIYAGAMDGKIYSIIDTTGKRDWVFNSGSSISGSPALLMSEQGNVEFDKLFFGTEAGSVHALQTNRGDLNWTYDASGEIIRASPLITHGIVYIGTMSGMLLALDEDGFFDGDQGMDETNESLGNGDLIWNLTLPGAIKSTPVLAAAEDLLIVASSSGSNHQIQALNRSTRAINWSYKLGGGIDGAPIVDAQNDRVYIGSNDQKMYAFDIQGFWDGNQGSTSETGAVSVNGDLLWTYDKMTGIPSPGAIDPDNKRLIFGTSTGDVYALNSNSGNIVWNFSVGSAVYAPPTIADGFVYVTTVGGIVYCLEEFPTNATNITLVWQLDSNSSIRSPAIPINNAIYFGTDDGVIYKLGAPNDPPVAVISGPLNNQTYFVGEQIILNATGSYDPEDYTNLRYIWTYTIKNMVSSPVKLYQGPLSVFNVTLPPENYTLHLEVLDSLGTPSEMNSTDIFVYRLVLKLWENTTIPAQCLIYYDGFGGIDLQAAPDPGAGTPQNPSGKSVGGTDKFVFQYYSSFRPNYKVLWYNVSVEYSSSDIDAQPEGYNFSRVRMFNRLGTSWVKLTNSGIYVDPQDNTRSVWANISGGYIRPNLYELYAPGTFDNLPATIEVVNDGFTPASGNKDTTFEFRIKFTDKDNDLPTTANGGYVKIMINDVIYNMNELVENNTDTSIGKFYIFTILGSDLNPTDNTFQILAHDGTYLTKSDVYTGPEVYFGESPIADAGDDFTVKVGEPFWLDGSISSDPDGNIDQWLWDIDGDGDFEDFDSNGSASGVKVNWIFEKGQEGERTITLKVVDEDGNTDTDTVTVTVEPKDGDDDDPKDNFTLLFASVLILIILIILIIILLMVRQKMRTERDRKAFMMDEEEELDKDEEEEELDEDEEELDEDEEEAEELDEDEEEFEDEDEELDEDEEEELDEEEEDLEDEELEDEELEKELEEELEDEELEEEELELEEPPEQLEELEEPDAEAEVEVEPEEEAPKSPKTRVKKPSGKLKKLKLKKKPDSDWMRVPKETKKLKSGGKPKKK